LSATGIGRDIRLEYDFSGGERAKYARRARRATRIVVLDPDVARKFKTSREVNQALRALIRSDVRRAALRRPKS
jgi:hypothetical protein